MNDIERWKKNIILVLKCLSDKEFQKNTWFGEDAYIFNPTELYSKLYDDNDIELFLDDNIACLNLDQLSLGKNLVKVMDIYSKKFPEGFDPKVVISDSDWKKVVKASQQFLQAISEDA